MNSIVQVNQIGRIVKKKMNMNVESHWVNRLTDNFVLNCVELSAMCEMFCVIR